MPQTSAQHEFTNLLPYEGAIALRQALDSLKWVYMENDMVVPGMFGPRTIPFQCISIPFANGDTIEVPWGQYEIKGMGAVQCHQDSNDGVPCFKLVGSGVKNEDKWNALLKAVAEQKVTLYQGRALRLTFGWFGEIQAPEELRLSKSTTLIFNSEVEEAIEASIFTLVENTQMCRSMHIPLKRGIVLEGGYGTGKSLTATVTAQKAIANGWTFLMVPHANQLDSAFKFAQRLQPCVVFVEDVDEYLDNDRENLNTILNTIDGIESKDAEIITIYSTNFVDSIDRAFLRPGRVDAMISITPPSVATVARVIEAYGGHSNPEVCTTLDGASPAIIREAVERAKLLSLRRGIAFDAQLINEAAKQLTRQRELMVPERKERSRLESEISRVTKSAVDRSMQEHGF